MSSYSKELMANNFSEAYKGLSEKQKEAFSSACFKLLNENYIYGQKDDERDLYYRIDSFKELIQNYFGLIDYELANDSAYKIFYLKSSSERNAVKLKKLESILLLLLRRFYYSKSRETNSDINISVTYDELLEDINKTGIYREPIKKTELKNAFATLKRYKIINFDVRSYLASDALTVYPTILYAVNQQDLDNISAILSGYGAKEEGDSDETSEDQAD